jgi:hypothetical protein
MVVIGNPLGLQLGIYRSASLFFVTHRLMIIRELECVIEDRRCLCHMLNNCIKDIIQRNLKDNYIADWKRFVSQIHQSNPFKELWDEICMTEYQKKVKLHQDCPTRFSSTVNMLREATLVSSAVEKIYDRCKHPALLAYHVSFLNFILLIFI